MNGMSLVISKPCCPNPMYNFGTRNKIDLIPRRLSNLHLQGTTLSVGVATTHMLKRRPYLLSALKDGKGGPRSQVPQVSSVVLPSVLLGVAIIGIFRFYRIPLLVAMSVAGRFLGHILYGSAVVLHCKPFSVGEVIEVGSVKGRVIQMGLLNTSLLSAENASIRVSNSLFGRQAIVNKSRAGLCAMAYKFFLQIDEIEKIHLISEEIVNMLKSNSNIYLEEGQPYCCLSGFQRYCVELTLRCNLKKMCKDELLLAKQDTLVQSAQIIKKHGATLAKHKEEVMGL